MPPEDERLAHLETRMGHVDIELGRLGTCMETLAQNQERLVDAMFTLKAIEAVTDRNSKDIQALFKLHREDHRARSFTNVATKWAPIVISVGTALGLGVKLTIGG